MLHHLLRSGTFPEVARIHPILICDQQAVHLIFNRWEPLRVPIVFPLLVLVPAVLSTLLAPHFSTLKALASTFAVFYGTLGTSIVIYRLSPFHPLAKYPGPFPAKISKLWHVWIVTRGKQHLYLAAMHEKYGDIIRMGTSLP